MGRSSKEEAGVAGPAGPAAGQLNRYDPNEATFPASAPAAASSRNEHPLIAFDDSTDENIVFHGVMSRDYSGGSLTVDLDTVAASATSGAMKWNVQFERIAPGGQDIDSDGFDTSAPRPDVYSPWAEDVIGRDGLAIDRFPLGDRTKETSPEGPAIVADAEGRIQELTAELRNETSRIRLLCEIYWNAAGGKTPDFSAANPEQEVAKDFTERSVQGTWSRADARERVELRVR